MEVNPWHRLAQVFLDRDLSLPEIGKALIIVSAVGLLEKQPEAINVGFNVLDNSQLHDALVLGLLKSQPDDKPISYSEIAKLLNVSQRVVGSAVNRLIERGEISKEDHGRSGAYYTVHEDKAPTLPLWVTRLTEALSELNNDPALKAQTVSEIAEINFRHGLTILQDELRNKFYRRGTGEKT